jgi:hypothetical protein
MVIPEVRETVMANQSYHKGKWRADVDADELAGGKFQGVVLLFHEDGQVQGQQIEHRVPDLSDTFSGAIEEAKSLAHRLLGDL